MCCQEGSIFELLPSAMSWCRCTVDQHSCGIKYDLNTIKYNKTALLYPDRVTLPLKPHDDCFLNNYKVVFFQEVIL